MTQTQDSNESVKTWRETRAALPEGMPHDAVELIRRYTAPARAKQRMEIALKAALEEANRVIAVTHLPLRDDEIGRAVHGDCRSVTHMHCAMLLCQIEVAGVGGQMGLGGDERGTVRSGWAQTLGKGRARASDGQAWTAAIRDAGGVMWTAIGRLVLSSQAKWPDDAAVLDLIDSPQSRAEANRRMLEAFDRGDMCAVKKWADIAVTED